MSLDFVTKIGIPMATYYLLFKDRHANTTDIRSLQFSDDEEAIAYADQASSGHANRIEIWWGGRPVAIVGKVQGRFNVHFKQVARHGMSFAVACGSAVMSFIKIISDR